jgi:hypothetical protein
VKRANSRGFAMSFMSIAKPLMVKTQAKEAFEKLYEKVVP